MSLHHEDFSSLRHTRDELAMARVGGKNPIAVEYAMNLLNEVAGFAGKTIERAAMLSNVEGMNLAFADTSRVAAPTGGKFRDDSVAQGVV